MIGQTMNPDTPWKIPPHEAVMSLKRSTTKKQRFEYGERSRTQKTPMTPLKREKFKVLTQNNDIVDFAYSPFRLVQAEVYSNESLGPSILEDYDPPIDSSLGHVGPVSDQKETFFNPFYSPAHFGTRPPHNSGHSFLWKSDHARILDKQLFTELPFPYVPSSKGNEASGNTTSYLHSQYQILETIGEGTFAHVFKIRKIITGEHYALKMGKKPFSGVVDRGRKLREVANLWQVEGCPNCLQIHEAWEQNGVVFIVTELCQNGTLQEVINYMAKTDARFTEYQVWQLLGQLAAGLYCIHERKIVHLDLKPANVLIDSYGTLKIGDFGVSVSADINPKDGDMEGDKYYLAPEILEGQFDIPADVFSLGLLIFELATGECLPSQGSSWRNLRLGDYSDLPFDDVPESLHDLILTMTDPDPLKRPKISEILHLFTVQSSRLSSGTLDKK